MPKRDDVIRGAMNDALSLAGKVPPRNQGIHFEDLLLADNEMRTDEQRVGRALAVLWARRNAENSFLCRLLANDTSSRSSEIARTLREWDVAYLTAATIIQWIGTPDGMSFLKEAFASGGGSLEHRYS